LGQQHMAAGTAAPFRDAKRACESDRIDRRGRQPKVFAGWNAHCVSVVPIRHFRDLDLRKRRRTLPAIDLVQWAGQRNSALVAGWKKDRVRLGGGRTLRYLRCRRRWRRTSEIDRRPRQQRSPELVPRREMDLLLLAQNRTF